MSSNTAEKQQRSVPGKPFVKGDKRINRKGRPKSFDALRDLAQMISHETVTNQKGDTVTVAEAILRQWSASKDPRLQMKFVEVAFGNAPTEINGTVTTVGITLDQWKAEREKRRAQVRESLADIDND